MTKTSEPHVESETARMGRMMDEADARKAAEIAQLRRDIERHKSMLEYSKNRLRDLEESPCANN